MLGEIFGYVAVFLLGWWGIGTSLVYLLNIFQFQIPFSKTMVKETIYDEKTHKKVLASKWVGAVLTLLLSVGVTTYLCIASSGLVGLAMTVLGTLVGFMRNRRILGYNVNNVCRFVRTHSVCMNRKKTATFLKREYDLDIDKLLPPVRK